MGAASTAQEYRDVAVWANLATDLDPQFKLVYGFAAVAVTFNLGRNTWVNGDESSALLRKGLAVFPDDFTLQFWLAHNLIFYDHDYSQAGLLLQHVSKLPGAPPYLGQLATRVMAQGGEIDAAIDFAKSALAAAQDDETRDSFSRRIKQLETERILQTVDRAVVSFREREGRLPTGVVELLVRRDLEQLPVDPSEGEIYIDKNGRGRSTAEARRLEVASSEQKLIDAEEDKNNDPTP